MKPIFENYNDFQIECVSAKITWKDGLSELTKFKYDRHSLSTTVEFPTDDPKVYKTVVANLEDPKSVIEYCIHQSVLGVFNHAHQLFGYKPKIDDYENLLSYYRAVLNSYTDDPYIQSAFLRGCFRGYLLSHGPKISLIIISDKAYETLSKNGYDDKTVEITLDQFESAFNKAASYETDLDLPIERVTPFKVFPTTVDVNFISQYDSAVFKQIKETLFKDKEHVEFIFKNLLSLRSAYLSPFTDNWGTLSEGDQIGPKGALSRIIAIVGEDGTISYKLYANEINDYLRHTVLGVPYSNRFSSKMDTDMKLGELVSDSPAFHTCGKQLPLTDDEIKEMSDLIRNKTPRKNTFAYFQDF